MRQCIPDLLVHQVATVAKCHPNTVRNADRKGLIRSSRDINGWRRFSLEEAIKLREMLLWRSEQQYAG